jgi:NAD(P)H-dependent flavin oxidoreductase YrpB (nitropropane dioxygenase family)
MSNRICASLGIRYPIFLGGLAGIGNAQLAAAVSNAGGLGLLGAALPWLDENLPEPGAARLSVAPQGKQ